MRGAIAPASFASGYQFRDNFKALHRAGIEVILDVVFNHPIKDEAWDAAGLYQVSSFVGNTWKEWNGRFGKSSPT